MTSSDPGDGEPVGQLRPFPPRVGAAKQGAAAHRPAQVDGEVIDFVSLAEAGELAREATFRRLAALAAEMDAVPVAVVSAAKESFAWRGLDDELAELVYDSTFDGDLLAGVRAGGSVGRQLTFQARDLVLEVEVLDGPQREMTCQVVPPQPAELEVRHRNGSIHLERDEFGMFHLSPMPAGPVSIRCVPYGRQKEPATTSWLTF